MATGSCSLVDYADCQKPKCTWLSLAEGPYVQDLIYKLLFSLETKKLPCKKETELDKIEFRDQEQSSKKLKVLPKIWVDHLILCF